MSGVITAAFSLSPTFTRLGDAVPSLIDSFYCRGLYDEKKRCRMEGEPSRNESGLNGVAGGELFVRVAGAAVGVGEENPVERAENRSAIQPFYNRN